MNRNDISDFRFGNRQNVTRTSHFKRVYTMDIAKKKKRKEKEPQKNDNITSKLSKCQSDVDVRECDTVVHTSNRDGSSRNTAPGSVSHCHEFHSASAASTLLSEAQINVDDVPMIMSVTVTNNPTRAAGRRLTARSSWYLGRTQTMAKNELASRYGQTISWNRVGKITSRGVSLFKINEKKLRKGHIARVYNASRTTGNRII